MNFERCNNGFVYEIQENDTLYQLSRRFSVPLVELMRANPYADVYQLKIGDTLCIPDFKGPGAGTGRPPVGPGKPPVMQPVTPGRPPVMPPMEPEGPSAGPEKPSAPPKPPVCLSCPMDKPYASPKSPACLSCPMEKMQMEPKDKRQKPWSPDYMEGARPWDMDNEDMDNYNIVKYVVQENDTIGNILSDFNMDMKEFFRLNNPRQVSIKPGSVILVSER